MSGKSFSLVLHSHIPYVLAHGSWPHGMDWLYEAAAETYLPLIDVFERLAAEGLPARASVSFTPVLMEQLKDPGFLAGFDEYLRMKIEIARRDREHFVRTGNATLARLTGFWEAWYGKVRDDFRGRCHGDILDAFRSLQDRGQIEVLTSAATHGYLPLLSRDASVSQQVRQGRETYRKHFGREPRGFWVPELAYRPGYAWKNPLCDGAPYVRRGVDEILGEAGLGYFFVDSHLLKGGEAKGVYVDLFPGLKLLWEKFRSAYEPAEELPNDAYAAGLAYPSLVPFFARDDISGAQVWSRDMGYPGDGGYLEFHKKHFPGGMRYWRITSGDADLGLKEPYDPEAVGPRLEAHAGHFVSVLETALAGRDSGTITALYDTELFGHWWFEGPEWIYRVVRALAKSSIRPETAGGALDREPPRTTIALPEGSWGKGGFHWIWLNDDTAWIWKKIYRIEEAAAALESRPERLDRRLLRQFYREKFLLESSDWPFLISTWSARDYAENRAAEHFERALTLAGWLEAGRALDAADEALLRTFEDEDHLFEEVVLPDGTLI
ncbi:MAG: putative alpha-amylase [Candidatus Aminicenantes bacterium]|jgi:1,4-alpha-glucan branching enzyme|nr:putative alpha-amylase [Candidatus Aminicenantes bacterium]MBP1769785.1 putative alpha-amylase [Candidatus Aminicenantes bacterium]